MTQAERDELHALASNIRDDRLRDLVFKLLNSTERARHDDDDRAVSRKR
jgi:hypothetical protein